jgi:hypothetical protein
MLTHRAAIETEATVAADADPNCRICSGLGRHWGWAVKNFEGQRDPVMLRCPCVDRRRQESQNESQ